MKPTKGRSKKLIVYEDKRSGSLLLNATTIKNGRFINKSPTKEYGVSLGKNTIDEELGKAVRRILKNCD